MSIAHPAALLVILNHMDSSPPTTEPAAFSSDLKTYSNEVMDVSQSTRDFLWHRHPLYAFFLFFIPICISIGIAYLEFTYGQPSPNTLGVTIFFVLIPLSIPVIAYANVRSKMQKLFYSELANALGCTYAPSYPKPTTGLLFSFGQGFQLTNVLSGTYKNISFRLADYTYSIGSGKSQHNYYYVVSELITQSTLPHIMVIPNSWEESLLGNKWKPFNTEPLSLEGDFNTKFAVFVEKGKEIEALQILEPDLMLKLMDSFEKFGFECVGSSIYLFTPGTMNENRMSMLALYTLIQRFIDIFLPELTNFSR